MERESATTIGSTELEPLVLDVYAAEIYCWRVEQLTCAGYEPGRAHALAEDTQIDLHLACDLVRGGCPEQTAFRILS